MLSLRKTSLFAVLVRPPVSACGHPLVCHIVCQQKVRIRSDGAPMKHAVVAILLILSSILTVAASSALAPLPAPIKLR